MGAHFRSHFPRKMGVGSRSRPSSALIYREGDNRHHAVVRSGDADPRTSLEFPGNNLTEGNAHDVYNQFMVARGSSFVVRVRDWGDWSTSPDHVTLPTPTLISNYAVQGVGDGVTTTFPLVKSYDVSVQTGGDIQFGFQTSSKSRYRRIYMPTVPGDPNRVMFVVLNNTSIPLLEGVQYTVDHDNGYLRFITPVPAGNVILACFTYDLPMRHSITNHKGLRCVVNAENDLTISDPKMTESWLGGEMHGDGERFMGGASYYSSAENNASYQIQTNDGYYQRLAFTGSGLITIKMPHARTLQTSVNVTSPNQTSIYSVPGDKPYFLFHNVGTSSFRIQDIRGVNMQPTTVVSPGQAVRAYLTGDDYNSWRFL